MWISVVHCWGNLWVPGVLFYTTNISTPLHSALTRILHIWYPIEWNRKDTVSCHLQIIHIFQGILKRFQIMSENFWKRFISETVQIAYVRMFVLASQGTQAPCVRQVIFYLYLCICVFVFVFVFVYFYASQGTQAQAFLRLLHPAFCHPECLNGGRCIKPFVCQCPTGTTGDQCQTGGIFIFIRFLQKKIFSHF